VPVEGDGWSFEVGFGALEESENDGYGGGNRPYPVECTP
jgi:hypothetical protein